MDFFNARASQSFYAVMAILCTALLSPGSSVALGQQAEQQNVAPAAEAPKIPNDQLDSLVAPIALYPDPLLSQTLVASTYPLEIIQLEQWMKKNKNLKGKALADAVEKQKWDPSIQSMAALPDVVKQLAENVSWTTDLGNAFLAQQSDVMDAVQRMRAKAQGAGNLKSSKQQKVEIKTVETKTVIVIEQADPQVVYVPAYNPTVVYGAPAYPYPPIAYPPGYGMLAFGTGVAIGAAWGNGGWGYGCGWGSNNNVTINTGNKYVNNSNKNVNNINNVNKGGNNNWQHNPQHRGAAPYSNKATANQYGGGARQQPAGGTGNIGASNRPAGGAGNTGAGNRPAGGAGSAGGRASTMPATRPSGGGANQIGNQSLGGGSGSGSGSRGGGGGSPSVSSRGGGGGFGGGGGSSARASSSRGGQSMGGGGFSRGGGGGGRGGGGRGGGRGR
jgi:hypothetical protein